MTISNWLRGLVLKRNEWGGRLWAEARSPLKFVLVCRDEHRHDDGHHRVRGVGGLAMGITDELRKWKDEHPVLMGGIREFDEMLDRIDAEHQKSMDEWKARNGQMWLKGYREYRAEIAEGNDAVAYDLEASGWVRLPLDADGMPIRVGDVMENIVCPSVHREATGVGVECFYGWDEDNARYSQFDAVRYRHHHAPTVEDVLREFYVYAERGKEHHREDVDDAVLAEYAARLRLAGDGE